MTDKTAKIQAAIHDRTTSLRLVTSALSAPVEEGMNQ